MLSQKYFIRIGENLRSATGSSSCFGGLDVLLVGDPYQLPPVLASSLHKLPDNTKFKLAGSSIYKTKGKIKILPIEIRS